MRRGWDGILLRIYLFLEISLLTSMPIPGSDAGRGRRGGFLFLKVVYPFPAAAVGVLVFLVLSLRDSLVAVADDFLFNVGGVATTSNVAVFALIFITVFVLVDVFSTNCAVITSSVVGGVNFDAACVCCNRCCCEISFAGERHFSFVLSWQTTMRWSLCPLRQHYCLHLSGDTYNFAS